MKLFAKIGLLALPLVLCVGVIVVEDPFKVIHKYNFGDYYNDQPYELNRDYVSTELLLSRYKQSPPNAFIFGSSRSFAHHCDEWQKYIPGADCFHYPAASENLFGVYSKIKLIDRLGLDLKHALIITDYTALGIENRKDHLHILHPEETGESWLSYHLEYLTAYFSKQFIIKYVDYRIFGEIRPYMRDIFQLKSNDVRIDPFTNDYFFQAEEKMLANDPDEFYTMRRVLFTHRDTSREQYAEVKIGADQIALLTELKTIFDKHRTNYKIVVCPLYDQVALNPQDVATLERIFGEDHLFDYSGRNSITEDISNYYDPGHYRPFVANAIMHQIYSK